MSQKTIRERVAVDPMCLYCGRGHGDGHDPKCVVVTT